VHGCQSSPFTRHSTSAAGSALNASVAAAVLPTGGGAEEISGAAGGRVSSA
jgi:hypothetical protein